MAKNDFFRRLHDTSLILSGGVLKNIDRYTVPKMLIQDARNRRLSYGSRADRVVERYWEHGDKKKLKKELWTGIPFEVRMFIEPGRVPFKNTQMEDTKQSEGLKQIEGSKQSEDIQQSEGTKQSIGRRESNERINSSFKNIKGTISSGIVNLLGDKSSFPQIIREFLRFYIPISQSFHFTAFIEIFCYIMG